MIDKNIFRDIRDKEMDRKTFLKYCGLFILSLVGFKSFLGLFDAVDGQKVMSGNNSSKATHGYGSSKYGR